MFTNNENSAKLLLAEITQTYGDQDQNRGILTTYRGQWGAHTQKIDAQAKV